MDRAIDGEIVDLDAALLDAIGEWHADKDIVKELHLYLGMTLAEYYRWVQFPEEILSIVNNRRD